MVAEGSLHQPGRLADFQRKGDVFKLHGQGPPLEGRQLSSLSGGGRLQRHLPGDRLEGHSAFQERQSLSTRALRADQDMAGLDFDRFFEFRGVIVVILLDF